ncbi:HEAT repeat domain-containing protein [candidate division KSB1 bacterium]
MKKNLIAFFTVIIAFSFVLSSYTQERESEIDKKVNELVNTLVKERRNWNDAAKGLIEIGEPAVEPLIKVLKDKSLDEWTRRNASWVIGDIKSKNAVDPLIEILNDAGFDPQIRAHAANALGKIGSKRAVDLLAQAVESEHLSIRTSAVLALGRLKSEKAIGPLVKSLNDENWMVRINAVGGLGNIGTEAVIDPLIRAAKDENDVVRSTAVRTLAKFKSESVSDVIVNALKDTKWNVRHTAKEELLKTGLLNFDKIKVLLKDKNSLTRWYAVHIMSKFPKEVNVELFLNALKDEDWMVRNEAAVALSRIKSEKVVESLRKILKSKKDYIRKEAAWVIEKIEGKNSEEREEYGSWMKKPAHEWPQITMINNIEYIDKSFPVAGCSFLLNTGKEVLAVTAKHILIYFKSEKMNSVSFKNTLKVWKMYPKDNPDDVVIIDKLINENPDEPILQAIPPKIDWLLFSIKDRSENIQPLKFRTGELIPDEKIYIIGWRYSDKNCPQVIYEGNYVKLLDDGSVIISTKDLANNKMPGLSGSPVIDSRGYVIGIMSQKYGKMEWLSSNEYPKKKLETR